MTKSEKESARRHLIDEMNSPKNRLIDLLRRFEQIPGSSTKAEKLASILGRLEAWQHSAK